MKEDFYKENMVQFFDEVNVLRSEKSKMVKTAQTMRELMIPFLHSVYKDIQDGKFLHEKMDLDYITDLITVYETFVSKVDKDILYDSDIIQKSEQFAKQIHNTNKNIVNAETDDGFQNAVRFGIPIKEESIPFSVHERFVGEWTPVEIGINESLFIHNNIRHKEYVSTGRTTHTWLTQEDEKVRTPHAEADGQTVPIDEPFIIGGYKMMYPGDTLTDNPPGNLTINCRCLEI